MEGKRGGHRPGAGRPKGSKNLQALEGPVGLKKAIVSSRLRVPKGAKPSARRLADAALQAIVDVMNGEVEPSQATAILKAATRIRDEICGQPAQKLEHSGDQSVQVSLNILKKPDAKD